MPLVKQAIHENDYVELTRPVEKVEGTASGRRGPGAPLSPSTTSTR
jgi:hypothetical protein